MLGSKFYAKKDDLVTIIAGKEKGKTGKILKVIPKKSRVVVENINFIKKHVRPGSQGKQGGIVEKEAPLNVSNVMIMCNKCNRPVRIGKKTLADGKKVRICKKCNEILDG